ncbi:MAG: cell division ATP-binding protein FtsE [Candidatus Latescibacterota bacterium]|nr:MAG: cell division ATP-binding protein FtsE [Candidatus Latescibacteria bacterium 4484_107]RKY71180.1 MAG: cell division ATP-binding protein FtsE [Candidatus Latescibacterota bacterium]
MVHLRHITVKKGRSFILEDVSFHIGRGEFAFLIGPSGAGKSTILRVIHLDEKPTSGQLVLEGRDAAAFPSREIPLWRRRIGVIFQDFKLLRDRNVMENVAFALRVTGARRGTIKRTTLKALSTVGISHKRSAMPEELSGGERQRVAIARALVHEPHLLLADQPTGDLDPESADEILALLTDLNHRGTAILMATHDARLVQGPHKILRIESGKLLPDQHT